MCCIIQQDAIHLASTSLTSIAGLPPFEEVLDSHSMGGLQHRPFRDVCRESLPQATPLDWSSETEHSKGSQSSDPQWHFKLCRGASKDSLSSSISNCGWRDHVLEVALSLPSKAETSNVSFHKRGCLRVLRLGVGLVTFHSDVVELCPSASQADILDTVLLLLSSHPASAF